MKRLAAALIFAASTASAQEAKLSLGSGVSAVGSIQPLSLGLAVKTSKTDTVTVRVRKSSVSVKLEVKW